MLADDITLIVNLPYVRICNEQLVDFIKDETYDLTKVGHGALHRGKPCGTGLIDYSGKVKNKRLKWQNLQNRFPKSYQTKVGQNARELLHQNSQELVEILNNHDVIKDDIMLSKWVQVGARNLYYIWKENNLSKIVRKRLVC